MTAITTGQSEASVVALLGPARLARPIWRDRPRQRGPAFRGGRLETAADRQASGAAPDLLLRDGEGLVVIDEVQRMPELFEALRPICDIPKRKTGSGSGDVSA